MRGATKIHKTQKKQMHTAAKKQKAKKAPHAAKKMPKKNAPVASLFAPRAFSSSVHIARNGPSYPLTTKESTLIAGLDVVPNGREVLESLYLHTIDLAKEHHTKTNKFLYKSIENFSTYRLNVLRQFPEDDLAVERIIGAGQIEELIEQAEEELMLMDMMGNHKERAVNEDIMKAHAPPFARGNPLCETPIYPLPEEVQLELASGKVTIVPFHPSKPLSRKFRQHLGFGDEITAEEHAEYDKIMTMTDDEKAAVAKKLKEGSFYDLVRADYEDCMLINKAEPLKKDYFEWFANNNAAYPENDLAEIARLTAMHEGTRKL